MEKKKSLKCALDGSLHATKRALNEADFFAASCGLEHKAVLHLRLLSEELISLANSLSDIQEGFFWLEQENGQFRLCLSASSLPIGEKARERILSISRTGENVFYTGVTGKIRLALDLMSEGNTQLLAVPTPYNMDWGLTPVFDGAGAEWSLLQYQKCAEREKRAAEWDELERSVLSRLADDVRVGVNSSNLSITIIKKIH